MLVLKSLLQSRKKKNQRTNFVILWDSSPFVWESIPYVDLIESTPCCTVLLGWPLMSLVRLWVSWGHSAILLSFVFQTSSLTPGSWEPLNKWMNVPNLLSPNHLHYILLQRKREEWQEIYFLYTKVVYPLTSIYPCPYHLDPRIC